MLEAFSIESAPGFAALHSLAREGSAVSTEAQTLRQAASDVVDRVERSEALFGSKGAAISQIWALANDHAEPDWDGNGAYPIHRLAVFKATAFIRALPDDLPLPEFAPEPDGSISLDWIVSRNRLFSMSVGTNDRLAYAWLDGADKGHAVARFDGVRVPTRILSGIEGIMKGKDAGVGPR